MVMNRGVSLAKPVKLMTVVAEFDVNKLSKKVYSYDVNRTEKYKLNDTVKQN
jgi:hypothetical protein